MFRDHNPAAARTSKAAGGGRPICLHLFGGVRAGPGHGDFPHSLSGLGVIMFAAIGVAPAARAQTYYPLDMPGSFSFGNFNLTLGTCTYQLNNGASTSCANDHLEMAVTTTKNSVTFTYVNSSNPGAPWLSQASANGCTCIQMEITVADTHGMSAATVSR